MKRFIFCVCMAVFCMIGLNANAQQFVPDNVGSGKSAESPKEFFDTTVHSSVCWIVVDSLLTAGWDVSVDKDGNMRKISAWRYVPTKYVVDTNSQSSKMSNKVNEDGTRSVTYKLSEPENGFAVFTMDRDGNLLSFQVYVTGDK